MKYALIIVFTNHNLTYSLFESRFYKPLFMLKIFSCFIIALILLNSCSKNKIPVNQVKNHFSVDEINLFYEANYSGSAHPELIFGWKEAIKIFIEDSTTNPKLEAITNSVIGDYNLIGLPMCIEVVATKEEANCLLMFLDKGEFSEDGCAGLTSLSTDAKKGIYSGTIKIDSALNHKEAMSVLHHELFHLFGFQGHITTNTSNILFPFATYNNGPDELAKRLLLMLYSVNWPYSYAKEKFEEDFSDVLFVSRKPDVLLSYMIKGNVNPDFINEIIKHDAFKVDDYNEEVVFKFPNNVNVGTDEGCPGHVKDSLIVGIQRLNDISTTFKVKYSEGRLNNGIVFSIVNDDTMPLDMYSISNIQYVPSEQHIVNFISHAQVSIKINPKSKPLPSRHLQGILYSVLVLKKKAAEINLHIFEEDDNHHEIKAFYKDYYNFYLSPALIGNTTKSELEEVLNLIVSIQ